MAWRSKIERFQDTNWYLVKTKTGEMREIQINQQGKNDLTAQGWYDWINFDEVKGIITNIEKGITFVSDHFRYVLLPMVYTGQMTPAGIVSAFNDDQITELSYELGKPPILSFETNKIFDDWHNGRLIVPSWFANNHFNWVITGQISQNEFKTALTSLLNDEIAYYVETTPTPAPITPAPITPAPTPEPEPEPTPEPTPEPEPITETWWVIRPSGLIEEVTVTQEFKDRMTAQGWIFSKDKPTVEEPQNQNISIVFYIGKGGDLKTHFGINSIVVTPDEAELLAGWLYQNYNTKILFVMNRLTDDVRTHTLQQIKDLIIQKLKDDEPESDDITPDDIKKPQELGIMGAGVGGAIGILILLGFIADSRRKK